MPLFSCEGEVELITQLSRKWLIRGKGCQGRTVGIFHLYIMIISISCILYQKQNTTPFW